MLNSIWRQAISLVPPSAMLVVQYHMESSATQHIVNDSAEITVLCGLIYLLNQDTMV